MSILEAAIGWLAPPHCVSCGVEGEALCVPCATSEILPHGARCFRCGAISQRSRTCRNCRRGGSPRFVWITTDYQGAAKNLLKVYKFGHQRAAALPLARALADTFLSFNTDEHIQAANYLVVPIPTATKRLRERSFDQATLLAQVLARQLGLQSQNVLGRLGQSRQVGAARTVRLKQPHNQYIVRSPSPITGRSILLVDDVVTTGATLQAAAKSLRIAGARRIDGLVFAKRL